MLGMIKNSLFGSVETWPWQILSKGGKVGPQGCRGLEGRPRPPHPVRGWSVDRWGRKVPGIVRSGVCRGHGPPMPSAWTGKEGSRRSGAAGRRALLGGGETMRQDGFEGRIPAYRDGLRLLSAFVHLNIPNFMNICSLRGLRLQERLEKCLSLRNSQTVLGGELNIKNKICSAKEVTVQVRERRRRSSPFSQRVIVGPAQRRCRQLGLRDVQECTETRRARAKAQSCQMACWPMGVGLLEYRMSEEGIIAVFPQINISAHPGKLDCPLKTNLPLDDNLLWTGTLRTSRLYTQLPARCFVC